ncbi:MAG: hypothetical protein IH605_02760, partial [Burkholderiales bacterium]|nr:hypothetical protein [Burkholderiales bacterium]
AFTISLSAADKAALNQIMNKDGTASTSATTYNLAAAEDWSAGADAAVNVVDVTNAITVSNVAVPAISSSTYDASAGSLVVTGTGFLSKSGGANDIVASKFTFTGEGGATYTLTDTSNVEITSGTAFTIALSATDKAALNLIMDKDGTASTSATTYNLAAAEDWSAGADAAVVVADLSGNGISVSNVNRAPAVTGTSTGQTVNDTATVNPFSAVTIADADANNVTAIITLDAAAKGVFTAASLTTSGFSSADGGITYTHAAATPSDMTTAIRALVFDPTDNRVAPGGTETTTFSIAINDGTVSTNSTNTTTVVSTSINDAPTLATPTAASYTDTGALDSFTNDTGTLAGGDRDSGTTLRYGIAGGTVTGGVSTLAGSYGSLSVNTSSGAYTYTPNATAINALSADSTDSFTVNVNDGALTTTATYTVNLTAADDTPALGGATAVTSINDTATATPFSAFTVTDADTAQIQTLTVTLDTAAKGALSNLSGGTYDAATGVYSFTGTAAQEQAAIRGLVYTPTANRVAATLTEVTTFTVSINDGIAAAATDATTTVVQTSVNDAPVLSTNVTSLDTTNEDNASSGITVTSILSTSGYSDVDSSALPGMAVTAAMGNGKWQYSADGTTWTNFGVVSPVAALLLDGGTSIRYVPGSQGAETPSISFHAWDQTSGVASGNGVQVLADSTVNGGSAAFSVIAAQARIEVTAVSRPVIPGAQPPQATSQPTFIPALEPAASPVAAAVRGARTPTVPSLGSIEASLPVFQPAPTLFDTLPAPGAGPSLAVDHGIPELSVGADRNITFAIPKDAFSARTPDVQLTFRASLADGAPLPGWLRFDPGTGIFSGVVPAGENEDLIIKVTAADNLGNEAVTTFTIKIADATKVSDSQVQKAADAPAQGDSAIPGKDLLAALGVKGFGLQPDDGVRNADQVRDPDAQQAASVDAEGVAVDRAQGDARSTTDSVTDAAAAHAPQLSVQLQREAQRFGQARAATLRHVANVDQARRHA